MFTDLLHLPIDRDRASCADQILNLTGMAWEDYERLTEGDFGYRTYIFVFRPSSFVLCSLFSND